MPRGTDSPGDIFRRDGVDLQRHGRQRDVNDGGGHGCSEFEVFPGSTAHISISLSFAVSSLVLSLFLSFSPSPSWDVLGVEGVAGELRLDERR